MFDTIFNLALLEHSTNLSNRYIILQDVFLQLHTIFNGTLTLGWALLGVKIETSMNRLATFHKVGLGRGEHDGEKSFRIGSLICPAVRAHSYA